MPSGIRVAIGLLIAALLSAILVGSYCASQPDDADELPRQEEPRG